MKADLYKHVRRAHGYTTEEIDELKGQRRQKIAASGRTVITCNHCDALFIITVAFHSSETHSEIYSLQTTFCPICKEEGKVCHSSLCRIPMWLLSS
ncbi:unnamed protein product [Strongylus vulgaris]|uniref:Uncharacterized protein n=1 Tax=Strongylus vulgaris TaxID=40348 RepID=A0A3P7LH66_STRVU|nr:unnamed protein product [Strongylus vulgaris]